MRFISTICFVLLTTVCFSQIYELIRNAGYFPKLSYTNAVQLCGIKGTLLNPIDTQVLLINATRKDSLFPKIIIRCGGTLNSRNNPLIVIDTRWASEVYFLQIYANGKLLASEKVMIQ